MSALIVGSLLIGIPLIGLAAAVVLTIGWDGLAFVVGALLAALAISGAMTLGIFLVAEGWSS
jgi:hypothetical protein